jgi:hypothetical protein
LGPRTAWKSSGERKSGPQCGYRGSEWGFSGPPDQNGVANQGNVLRFPKISSRARFRSSRARFGSPRATLRRHVSSFRFSRWAPGFEIRAPGSGVRTQVPPFALQSSKFALKIPHSRLRCRRSSFRFRHSRIRCRDSRSRFRSSRYRFPASRLNLTRSHDRNIRSTPGGRHLARRVGSKGSGKEKSPARGEALLVNSNALREQGEQCGQQCVDLGEQTLDLRGQATAIQQVHHRA